MSFYRPKGENMDFEKVKSIIVDTLACDEDKVTPEARFIEDLEVDSLSLVELHMALEDELGHSIPDGEIGKLQTVQELVDYCNK
jgi:acyl carrier protein